MDKIQKRFEEIAHPYFDLDKNGAGGYEDADAGRAWCVYQQGWEDARAAALEEAAKEADHWNQIGGVDPKHVCGKYIAAAIRGLAQDESGEKE